MKIALASAAVAAGVLGSAHAADACVSGPDDQPSSYSSTSYDVTPQSSTGYQWTHHHYWHHHHRRFGWWSGWHHGWHWHHGTPTQSAASDS